MIQIGTQYYRPPFPVQKYWSEDMKRMKDAGLDSVQLWIVWAWVESKQGKFDFSDYDKLVELAHKNDLSVVLSTSAELHPYWIHKAVPNSEMINNYGHKVISGNRCENNFGLTPGGCFDHPEVWSLMKNFLEVTTKHYRDCPNLAGWDAWNELRYHENSESLVCFCEHTIKKWRDWLLERFGSLDELNRVWMRRYQSFEEILPGKSRDRTYTEMMSWQHFRTWNCDDHGRKRYDAIKTIDPHHDVTAHAATPSPLMKGDYAEYAIDRGNDWELAKNLDGIGCSSFPKWFGLDDASFGMRIEFVHSAAKGKKIWLSEIQGGRSAIGFDMYDGVDASSHQRWVWNGIACGADKILFWCWRDEVFGRESGGFGIIGRDGLADERVAGLQTTRKVIDENKKIFETYKPYNKVKTGILFSPQSYYLTWSQEGVATRSTRAMEGYARALVRSSVPYVVLEENNLESLKDLKILFLPRVLAMPDHVKKALSAFVKNGGTLVCESESGAFTPEGFYHYPDDRFLFEHLGIEEIGRRAIEEELLTLDLAGENVRLPSFQWLTPMISGKADEVYCKHKDGDLIATYKYGKGHVLHLGSYFGEAYLNEWNAGFERLVSFACEKAGVKDFVEVVEPKPLETEFLYVKHGLALDKNVLYLFFPTHCQTSVLRLNNEFVCSGKFRDLFSGEIIVAQKDDESYYLRVNASKYNLAVLVEV